jgi:hypothetical protein
MFITLHSHLSGKLLILQIYLAPSVSFIVLTIIINNSIIFLYFIVANVFIKYINDTSAWVALKDGSQAKAMNKILPKLQSIHKNIVLLPWSDYYKNKNTAATTLKRKIDECLSSNENNVDSSIVNDGCAVDGQTPEKVLLISKG